MIHSEETIFLELKKMMQQLFAIDPQQVTLVSRLYEDLGLDSIDAVDLVVHLQTLTKKKFQPAEFKAVRTVGDVVTIINAKLSAP